MRNGNRIDDQPLELVYCSSVNGEEEYKKGKYTVVEIEVCRMGYYKEFASKEEYERYSAWKEVLRMTHNKQVRAKGDVGLVDTALCFIVIRWLDSARDFVNTWGEDYTPEDLRMAIDEKIEEQRNQKVIHWNHHIRSTTTILKMGEVDRFKFEVEDWS